MLEELKSTTGRIEKEEILSFNDTPFIRFLLQEALDPNLLHHAKLTKRNIPVESGLYFLEEMETNIRNLFDTLHESQSSVENKKLIKTIMKRLTEEDQEALLGVINKKPKVGISIKTVNKVFPGLIDVKKIQLANKYLLKKKYTPEFYWWSFKLDGVRVFCFRIDGKWRIYSRAKDYLGQELHTLDHWKPYLESFYDRTGKTYTEGEAYLHGLTFSEIQSAVFSTVNKKAKLASSLHLHSFIVGNCNNTADPEHIKEVELSTYKHFFEELTPVDAVSYGKVVNDPFDIGHYMGVALEKRYEGIMLRDPNFIYSPKRDDCLLKVKTDSFDDTMERADCVIIDIHFDDITVQENGVVTSEYLPVRIDVEQYDGKICGVGGGFDMKWRRETAKDPEAKIGRTVEVKFQGYGAQGRMRFPQFERERLDV
jgi:DNA ligase-1